MCAADIEACLQKYGQLIARSWSLKHYFTTVEEGQEALHRSCKNWIRSIYQYFTIGLYSENTKCTGSHQLQEVTMS
jgi:hypothetical protein